MSDFAMRIEKSRRDPLSNTSAQDNNEFAAALYEPLRQRPGNLFLSPFSIRAVLALAYAGARGETAAQMRSVLRNSAPDETLHDGFAQVVERLQSDDGHESPLSVANSLWTQAGAHLQADFVDLVSRHYGPVVQLVDFERDAVTAREMINRWVLNETKQRIRDLIPPGSLTSDSRLVLVNAVYFKSLWSVQFPKDATRDEPFYLTDGGRVRTALMYRRGSVSYAQEDGYQVIELPYRNANLSMIIVLPDRKDGLPELERRSAALLFTECSTGRTPRDVRIFLPRFTITWGTVSLVEQLTALGMRLAFRREDADFSGINGFKPPHPDGLSISDVLHQAFVDVNESGTEAAAATAVAFYALGSMAPRLPQKRPTFRADHPFLFAIVDRLTSRLLFMGRVDDPTRGR
jgi:serpin B